MGDEAAEIGSSDAVVREESFGDLGHLADGELVDSLAVLVDEVLLGVHGGVGGGEAASSGGHVERDGTGAVDLVVEIDEADFSLFAGLEQDSTGAVAKDDAGGSVGVVDDGAHDVGANDEDLFVRSGFDELCSHLEGVGEARAGGGEVETPGVGSAELILHEAGGSRKGHVGSDGRDDDGFDFGGVDTAAGEADFGGFDGEIAGGDPFLDQVTLADAGAFGDPLVVGGDHFFEVCVGEQAGWNIGAYG